MGAAGSGDLGATFLWNFLWRDHFEKTFRKIGRRKAGLAAENANALK
jgi:hypothetical protein